MENKVKVNPEIEKVSNKILSDLYKESTNQKLPVTRVGVIKEIRKADDYEKTKKRLFVIQCDNGYVFMKEDDAPDWLQKQKKRTEIEGKEVEFKGKEVDENDRIFVSSRIINDVYEKAQAAHFVLTGKVTGLQPNQDPNEETLIIMCKGDVVYMKRPDVSLIYNAHSLAKYIGKRINFVVKEIKDNTVYVSRKIIQEQERDAVIEKLKNGESLEAKVMQVFPWGARLNIDTVVVLLKNKDFATDYTHVEAVKKKGDIMLVKLADISKTNRISVQPVEKYTSPYQINFDKFERGQIVLGTVTNVLAFGCFVNIAPGVDALCPIEDTMREPEQGNQVRVRIQNVIKEERRVRGRIIGYIEDEEEEE